MEKNGIHFRELGDAVILHGRQVLYALALLVVGLLVAKLFVRLLKRVLDRFMANKAQVATICNTIFVLLTVVVFTVSLEQMGWRSIVINRILIGLALAAAAVILLMRPLIPSLPFKAGNTVDLGGLLGKVEAITLLTTRLRSFDGKTYFIPNRMIINDIVVNYHFTPTRQVRLPVTIRYSDDLLKAKKVLAEIMTAEPKVAEKPAPKVYVVNLGDNGVELSARCWVENVKYWTVRCALLEKVKLRFDEEGIVIPFPQRDVHLDGKPDPSPGAREETEGPEK